MPAPTPHPDRAAGALLGAAIGDALGAPIERLSHQNVRTYYKGIKGYRADEKRGDLRAGEGTHRAARAIALAEALAGPPETPLRERVAAALHGRELPRWDPDEGDRPTGSYAAAAAPLGVWAARTGVPRETLLQAVREAGAALGYRHPNALAAAFGQASAVQALLGADAQELDGPAFVLGVAEATAWAERALGAEPRCSARLRALADHLGDYPLDLQDRCAGTGPGADEAWPFAVAMAARNPSLVEATLLSAINVGGDAPTVGACTGALLGALHGPAGFPEALREGLRGAEALELVARRLPPHSGG